MKYIKWKILIVTCLVCLLPILLGVVAWDELPEEISIHFDFNNEPDNFVSKEFGVFGLPIMMVMLQIVCCIVNDINSCKHGGQKKLEVISKWLIPFMSLVLQVITIGYALGWNVDIRRFAMLIVGVVLLVVGKYLPELDYVKNYCVDAYRAKKINGFVGRLSVIMGILALVTVPFPPIVSVVWLILLIPYVILTVVYTIKVLYGK